jgi:hypothetical protein
MELTNTEPTLDLHSPERAVFVTDDHRRARRLRRGAYAAASLACLWLVGLGVGMFGLGGLPGISLGKQNSAGTAGAQPEPNQLKVNRVARSLGPRSQVAGSSYQNQRARDARARSARARARPVLPGAVKLPVSNPPVLNPAPPAPQQPVNPVGRQRGWSRKGNQSPPGQVRRTQPPPPPPPSSRGQHRGQTETTTKPPPPGQSKKTPPPPPPPEG